MTGGLLDPHNVQIVRELQWDDIAVVGFADVRDPAIDERLLAAGYVEVFGKPIVPEEVAGALQRLAQEVLLTSGAQVRVEPIDGAYWMRRFDGARRIRPARL